MAEFFLQRPWFIDSLLFLFLATLAFLLIRYVMKAVGGDLELFFKYLKEEREEYKKRQPTLGAMNWRCVTVLLLFGVLVLVGSGFSEVISVIEKWIGKWQTQYLEQSVNAATLFYVLAVVIVISVMAVFFSKQQN